MGLLDNKYCLVTLSDGSKRYLPVPLSTTCGQRPTLAQAQAQFSSLLATGFEPVGYHLVAEGCVITTPTTNPGTFVISGDQIQAGDDGAERANDTII